MINRNIWPGERLRMVAELIPPCGTLYDIGSNHGKLPAFLLESGKCKSAIVTDISEKSLQKARELFEKKGLAASFLVNDGLKGLFPSSQDIISLCGMGAQVMLNILPAKLPCPVVLQPSARVELLRSELRKSGHTIGRERLAREAGRFYVCLFISPGNESKSSPADEPSAEKDAFMGSLRGDPLYADYLLWRRAVLEKALRDGSPDKSLKQRLLWVEEELCFLR